MKSIFYSLLFVCFFSSCKPIYQVFELSSADSKTSNSNLVYENKDIKITYDFWSNGGQVYFKLTNKTDNELYIDWDKSHLIYNGISYEYWNDIEETSSFYAALSTSTSNTFSDAAINLFRDGVSGSSTSSTTSLGKKIAAMTSTKVKPKKIIFLPARSSVLVSKFIINKSPYYTCDFNLKGMKSRSPKKVSFSKENSPLEFRNQILYSTDDKFINRNTIDNSFYISGISFMTEKTFKGKEISRKECNIEGSTNTVVGNEFPYQKINSFYIIAKQK